MKTMSNRQVDAIVHTIPTAVIMLVATGIIVGIMIGLGLCMPMIASMAITLSVFIIPVYAIAFIILDKLERKGI